MHVSYTFRNIASSDALRDAARERIERKLGPFLTDGAELHVILETEGLSHIAELNVLEKQLKTSARAESEDMYKSVHDAIDKLEKQLRRRKERIKNHHR